MGQAFIKKCSVCKTRDAVEKFKPFCSARCADIDLGGWLGEKYRMPTNDAPGNDSSPDDESGIE